MAGALALGRLPRGRHRGLIIYSGLGVTGLMTMLLGLPFALPGVIIAMFMLGAALAMSNLVWNFVIQEYVPPRSWDV